MYAIFAQAAAVSQRANRKIDGIEKMEQQINYILSIFIFLFSFSGCNSPSPNPSRKVSDEDIVRRKKTDRLRSLKNVICTELVDKNYEIEIDSSLSYNRYKGVFHIRWLFSREEGLTHKPGRLTFSLEMQSLYNEGEIQKRL